MSGSNEGKKDTLQMARPSKLSLTKTVESGKVKQNFQYGRSKTVTVEVRRTRTFAQEGGKLVEVKKDDPLAQATDAAKKTWTAEQLLEEHPHLTEDERQARLRALKTAEEEAKLNPRAEPAHTSRDEERSHKGTALDSNRPAVITAPKKAAKAEAQTEEVAAETQTEETRKKPVVKGKLGLEIIESESNKKSKIRLRPDESRRGSGKITVSQALNMAEERQRSLASMRRRQEKMKKADGKSTPSQLQEKMSREVVVPEVISIQELANRMAERAVDVVKFLMKMGEMVTVNQTIDADTAELIANEFGHKIKRVTEGDVENVLREETEAPENLRPRPPVVTIMGHVDHGKTSLLDALRHTDVVAGEAGGITQHIGAYQVELKTGQRITFLDTPGHEAFTAMRARGAKVTDIVVLVVAADDGIMEQTKEAISHAKAANVPIIVAINKIDKPDADPQRVRNEMMQYELVPEEFGGDTIVVEVSAKQKTNLDKLEETILLQAEVLELKANPNRPAVGAVVEAKISQGRGVAATLLVQKGTLNVGDILVAGPSYGRVRALINDKGKSVESAGPGDPVEILGLDQPPVAGDEFNVVENEKTARDIVEYRQQRSRAAHVAANARSLENMFTKGTKAKELTVIIKADVQGSAEAITASLQKMSGDEVSVRVMHSGVGAISESDVTLANATGAIIIGFNVRATTQARSLAEKYKLDIRYYSIIYNVVDDIKAALSGMLSPVLKENFLGYAEIRQVFSVTKAGKVAGCMVTEGIIKRGAKVRLLRDNVVIHEGTLSTLKRFKDDVKEVKSGLECGMAFENYQDIQVGDMIEAFEIEEVARTIQ